MPKGNVSQPSHVGNSLPALTTLANQSPDPAQGAVSADQWALTVRAITSISQRIRRDLNP